MPKLHLANIGRIFYGFSIAVFGVLTIVDRDFPYFFIPPKHDWATDHPIVIYIGGILLVLAGMAIANKLRVSIALGAVLLAIFCLYFIPYQLFQTHNALHFGTWENAAKELALAGGAWTLVNQTKKAGTIIFALTIISFSIDHFLFAREAQGYIPDWIPAHLFWMYFTGTALLASGVAILLNIKRELAAILLGSMIFIWVIILHLPKALTNKGEISSAFLALAYCGIAFIIAGEAAGAKAARTKATRAEPAETKANLK